MTGDTERFDILQAVSACHFLADAGERLVRPIAAISSVIHQPKGTLVFDQGDACRGMFIVHAGAVKILKTGPDGREHVLHVVHKGDCFGEAALFLGTGYPAAAQAVTDSVLILTPKEKLLGLLRTAPDLCLQMMGAMAIWARRLVDKVEILTLKDAGARLADYLLNELGRADTRAESPARVQLRIPKNVLASHLAMSNETLSRLLARFEAHGLIAVNGRVIRILDGRELRGLAEFGSE